jgi:hypothetical protein
VRLKDGSQWYPDDSAARLEARAQERARLKAITPEAVPLKGARARLTALIEALENGASPGFSLVRYGRVVALLLPAPGPSARERRRSRLLR